MQSFYQWADPYLIWFYRLSGSAWVDFVLGTFVLACLALLVGEISVSLALRYSRKGLDYRAEEAARYQRLAIEALRAGDKEAHDAANKLANEAFGHTFFQQAALSAAFLWPVLFALAWMQTRFLEVEFPIPGTSWSLGFIGVFIIIYVAAYLLHKRVKNRLTPRVRESVAPDAG
ncbi:MAG: hypothetical protein FJ128_02380 [Deltaproteobacteria bacterium]|nr:hypothetical protein [Deltaproteobacteria bacterium]